MSDISIREFAPAPAIAPANTAMSASGICTTPDAGTGNAVQQQPQQQQSTVPTTHHHTRADGPRRTSYFSSFQTRCSPSTDNPPSYSISQKAARIPRSDTYLSNGGEVLPEYVCTVQKEGVMSMRIEKLSPFQRLPTQQFRPVYVVLQGPQLCIHKIKSLTLGGVTRAAPGRLIRRYTLQHAEIGLANDITETVLIPVTKLAHLIPAMARRKAFEKDPDMFRCDKQFAIRVRAETDQLLLADTKEETVFSWISSISAGIDIAYPIDERSVPRQCTVPQRQRQRRQDTTHPVENLQDRRLIQEQEQILREMYPSLARSVDEGEQTLQRIDTVESSPAAGDLTLIATNINDQEAEDIDLSVLAEDAPDLQRPSSRPNNSRRQTGLSLVRSATGIQPSTDHFDESGKWAPVHPYSLRSQFRYTRRCMPTLLFDAPRASNILICNGRRLHLNHKMDMLEYWELSPPTYDAHKFSTPETSNLLQRTHSHVSTVETSSLSQSTSDAIEIHAVQQSPNLSLDVSVMALEKTRTNDSRQRAQQDQPQHRKKVEERAEHLEIAPMEPFSMVVAF